VQGSTAEHQHAVVVAAANTRSFFFTFAFCFSCFQHLNIQYRTHTYNTEHIERT
jgi:hypothetical protein